MQQKKAEELINKYLQGSASLEEKAWVETWYLKYYQVEFTFSEKELIEDKGKSLQELMALANNRKKNQLWYSIYAAAAAIALVIFSVYFFKARFDVKNDGTENLIVNDIAPGKHGATLTLGNGRRIKLSDVKTGELAKEAGIRITKTADGQLIYNIVQEATQLSNADIAINTLTTVKGETYQVHLPDGSLAYLNAESSLSYPTSFANAKERVVKLVGEAYFEIKKDRLQPFIVQSKDQEIRVLGTHFNVNCYSTEESIKTTLVEGVVEVSANKLKKHRLKPNQQTVFRKGEISIHEVDVQVAVAWKNGYFSFENADLKTVMQQISRWYDVDVVFGTDVPNDRFTGKVPRDMNLSKVLEVLSFAEVDFKIVGKKMIISPK